MLYRTPFVLFAIAISLIFGNVLDNKFVWDDKIFIIGKPIYRQFDIANILLHPFSPANGVEYLPVRDLSYVIDYFVWGESDFGFHLTNLLIYFFSVILIYLLTKRIVELIEKTNECVGLHQKASILPLGTALLFLVHPLHVQSVAFVMQRNTLLAGMFSFAALLFYIKYLTENPGTFRIVFWLMSLFCCLAAFFSKGTSIVLPLVMTLLLSFTCYRRKFQEWLALVPFFAFSMATAFLFNLIAHHTGFVQANPMEFGAFSPLVKLVKAVQIPWFYLYKLVYPTLLSPEYAPHFSNSVFQFTSLLSLAVVLITGFLSFRFRRTYPLAIFAIGCYFIFLLPVLNLLPTHPVVADRYAYLPSFGFCLLLSCILATAMKHAWQLLTVFFGISLCFCVLSHRENRVWRDDKVLYQRMIDREPQLARGYARLGYTLLSDGNRDEALRLFKKAADIDPLLPDFECQMGSRALKTADYATAAEWFDKALMRRDTHIVSLFLCGIAYIKANDILMASSYFARVLNSPDTDIQNLKPQARFALDTFVRPVVEQQVERMRRENGSQDGLHHALAKLYARYHLYADTLRELNAVKLTLPFEEKLLRAETLLSLGKYEMALAQFNDCLKERPHSVPALYGAGVIFQRLKKFSEALERFEKVSQIDSTWGEPVFQQAMIHFLIGNKVESRTLFKNLHRFSHLKWKIAAYEKSLYL